ncbi:calcium-binding protein [Microvirga rosea]|uniref:calcium-binding protein n=1 Tax=Microvirga rosea TaxID=2715425 RepID=UPI001D0B7FF4|nr:calcium-binding protein [Microvirga rosea]MCB8820419.1 hypothetical protein [Microvirga rosea]
MANDIFFTIDNQRTTEQDFTPVESDNVHVIVTEAGRVATTTGNGIKILFPAHSCQVTVDGFVSSQDKIGVHILNGSLFVGETGRVEGMDGFWCANTSTVTNRGTILGTSNAISGSDDMTVVNYGTLKGGTFGINFQSRSRPLTVTNEHIIEGGTSAIYSGKSDDIVFNKGLLSSIGGTTVTLGDGKDYYDSTQGGRATGIVNLGAGVDTARGGDADDVFYGGDGNDLLVAGGGHNTLNGGDGADTLDGSGGTTLASYQLSAAGVTVDLAHEELSTGTALGDHFINIMGVEGSLYGDTLIGDGNANDLRGMHGADSLVGGDGADTLTGGDANDTLVGGLQNDWLDGGAGNDKIEGGDGWDLVSYLSTGLSAGGIELDLATNQNGGAASGDVLVGIEAVQGTNSDDVISGFNIGLNGCELHGEKGNDILTGKAGGDILFGDSGHDTLIGGGGADRLYGGNGLNLLKGGAGGDLLDGSKGESIAVYDDADTGVTVNLADESKNTGDAAGDHFVEIESVWGSVHNDVIVGDEFGNELDGDAGADILNGGKGHDLLYGSLGDDTLQGSEGNDILEGGLGQNTAVYTGTKANYVITQQKDGTIQVADRTGAHGTDTLKDIALLQFADGTFSIQAIIDESQSLVLIGTPRKDALVGKAGDDIIKGLGNNDALWGAGGNDRLWGGLGNDVMVGGQGQDVFAFNTKLAKSNKTNKKTNLDKIADFNVKDDTIWLDNAVFKKLGKGTEASPGKLNKAFFSIGDHAKTAKNTLFYDKNKGALFYDADGSGAKEAIQIASLAKKLKMTADDFKII